MRHYQVQVSTGKKPPQCFTSISGPSTKEGHKQALDTAINVAQCRVEEGQYSRVMVMEYDVRGKVVGDGPVWDSCTADATITN